MNPYLNQSQIKELTAMFKRFDKNGDGHISLTELGDVMRGLNKNPSEQELREIMEMADTDGNGTIELNEFLALMARYLKAPDTDDDLREAFAVFDIDGNGRITREELKKAMQTFGEPMTDKECEEMMRVADKNGDGVIDYEEFIAWMMSR